MKFMKKQCVEFWDKFGGWCVYCGVDFLECWYVDYYEVVKCGVSSYVIGRDVLYLENYCMENMMFFCLLCNISKGSMMFEVWCEWLVGYVNSLNVYYLIY